MQEQLTSPTSIFDYGEEVRMYKQAYMCTNYICTYVASFLIIFVKEANGYSPSLEESFYLCVSHLKQ